MSWVFVAPIAGMTHLIYISFIPFYSYKPTRWTVFQIYESVATYFIFDSQSDSKSYEKQQIYEQNLIKYVYNDAQGSLNISVWWNGKPTWSSGMNGHGKYGGLMRSENNLLQNACDHVWRRGIKLFFQDFKGNQTKFKH